MLRLILQSNFYIAVMSITKHLHSCWMREAMFICIVHYNFSLSFKLTSLGLVFIMLLIMNGTIIYICFKLMVWILLDLLLERGELKQCLSMFCFIYWYFTFYSISECNNTIWLIHWCKYFFFLSTMPFYPVRLAVQLISQKIQYIFYYRVRY